MKPLGFLFISKESWTDTRWARKQWLPFYLAKRDEVDRIIYVDRHRAWWRSDVRTKSVQQGKITVCQYNLSLPFERSALVRSWNRRFIAKAINAELDPSLCWIAIFYHPYDVDLIKFLPEHVVTVFDWTEDWAVFHKDRELTRLQYEAVTSSAMVLTVTEELRCRAIDWRNDEATVHLLANATAFSLTDEIGNPPSAEVKAIPSPIIGFIGHLGPWFDAGLVVELARLHPEWQWVLIGGVNDNIAQRLKGMSSIHCLGVKPPSELISLMLACDILIAPYVSNISGDATKLYDYLVAGKPIISSPCETAERLQPHVIICDDPKTWSDEISRALSQDNDELLKRRQAAALDHHWNKRIDRLLELVRHD